MKPPFRTVYILGSSGFAHELLRYIVEIFDIDQGSILFVDDNDENMLTYDKYISKVSTDHHAVTFIGSGNTTTKSRMEKQIIGRTATIIHPRAFVSKFAFIGEGTIVAPGAVVAPNAIIGRHCLINYNASIGHDSFIGNLSVVSPNAAISGWVKTGEQVYVGAGAQIRERLEIGDRSTVAMGASVVRDVPSDSITVGVPAIIYTNKEWKEKKNGRETSGN